MNPPQSVLDGLPAPGGLGRPWDPEINLDLNRLLQDVTRHLPTPEDLTVAIPEPLPPVHGSRNDLQWIFRTLLREAIQGVSRPYGRVLITYRRIESAWEFAVQDNRQGGPESPPPASEGRNPPFPLGTHRRELEGVQALVTQRGGQVSVAASEATGVVVRFTWPDRVAPPSTAAPPPRPVSG
jgi:hypothetical protein